MKKSFVNICCLTILLSCCLVENVYSQADAGPDKFVCKGKEVRIEGKGSPDWCYSWNPTTGLSGNLKSPNPMAKPTTTTTYTLTVVGPNFSFTSTDQVTVTVVEVTISPTSMSVVESLNSGDYTVTVTPNTVTPTYEWTWKAPSGAGNSPNVTFNSINSKNTRVNSSRWFAFPNDRHWNVTGTSCTYEINCKVRVNSETCEVLTPARLIVNVDPTGQTSWPQFAGANTIQVSTRVVGGNTEWYVSGIGSFRRTAPTKTLNLPTTSQFYNKVNAHESKHVTQWTSENPWQNLFNANGLYNSTLKYLKSTISENDLRNKISNAINNQNQIDAQTAVNTRCAREIGAFTVDRGVAPHYLELDNSEVPAAYNCTP